ncbi:MAG: hypothetical protein HC824_10935 [Synechococcales cyanobacterium RM1_1_8]|nr:hypothetical protein [Synechococcales cyanobacterium RM1_1_8]
MSYSDFTINAVKKQFAVALIEDQALFETVGPVDSPPWLKEFLVIHLPLADAIGTEKAKSEFVVAPILSATREVAKREISLFSGIEFNVDKTQGLVGRCDFIVSQSRSQYSLSAPVLALVETKNDRINAGIGQCMAEMIAAEIFNHQEGNALPIIFGCVTTGDLWRFLKLESIAGQRTIFIDSTQYFASQVERLLGILTHIASV